MPPTVIALVVAFVMRCTGQKYEANECTSGADCFAKYRKYLQCSKGPKYCMVSPSGAAPNATDFGVAPCGPGTFNSIANQQCQACAAGKYQDGSWNFKCKDVGSGYISSENRTAKIACQPGTFQPDMSGPVCFPCPVGKYVDTEAAALCKNARPGYTSNENRTAEVPCGPGTYHPVGGDQGCVPCSAGTYTNKSATVKCTLCEAGYHQSISGQTECLPCNNGAFSIAEGTSTCESCGLMNFNEIAGPRTDCTHHCFKEFHVVLSWGAFPSQCMIILLLLLVPPVLLILLFAIIIVLRRKRHDKETNLYDPLVPGG